MKRFKISKSVLEEWETEIPNLLINRLDYDIDYIDGVVFEDRFSIKIDLYDFKGYQDDIGQWWPVLRNFKEINLTFDEIMKSSKWEINSE